LAEIKKRIFLGLDAKQALAMFGAADANLKLVENEFGVRIYCKDSRLTIKGSRRDAEKAEAVLEAMKKSAIEKGKVDSGLLEQAFHEARFGKREPQKGPLKPELGLVVSTKREPVVPRTKNQREYVKSIFENQIVFGIGPAGTGKTYLATAAGLFFLREKMVERIILVRPVVEAGENLGFLPGDLKEKIDPYLRPLFDAIYDMLEPRIFHELVENEVIEIAPLAYMRGRTLNKAFVILDEAQNTTIDQMKMFLTRTGNDTKLVITGDITQIDLPVGKKSGLIHASEIFEGREDGMKMSFCRFTAEDVSRAEIVKKILEAYDRYENS